MGSGLQKDRAMIRSMELSALPLTMTTFLVTRGLRSTFCCSDIFFLFMSRSEASGQCSDLSKSELGLASSLNLELSF